MKEHIEKWTKKKYIRVLILVILDIITLNFVSFFSVYIRYDFKFMDIMPEFWDTLINMIPCYTLIAIICFNHGLDLKFPT